MEDFERYSDYTEYEEDIVKEKSKLGFILKLLVAIVCLSVVGLLAFRLIIFNTYPDSMEEIYFNDKLTAYYEATGGKIGALTQDLRAEYDDPDEGNFFCDNLIVIKDINQLQVSVRFNTSLMTAIKKEYGVTLDPDSKDLFTFKLSVLPLSKDDGTAYPTATETQNPVVKTDKRMMYRYYKLVFDGVDFELDGEEEIWIRLEIFINGVEMKEPYMVLLYEDREGAKFESYKLSSGEKPKK